MRCSFVIIASEPWNCKHVFKRKMFQDTGFQGTGAPGDQDFRTSKGTKVLRCGDLYVFVGAFKQTNPREA